MQRVCILTAGSGSRMGSWSRHVNKALLPIEGRAAISRIIENFDDEAEFVVALGDDGHQIQDYLSVAHPENRFTFVKVSPASGPGSGPGTSLLCCEEHLKEPFYLVCSDTLWSQPIPKASGINWVGLASYDPKLGHTYCRMSVDSGFVTDVYDKEELAHRENLFAFVGLFFIFDHEVYFAALRGKSAKAHEIQLSFGLSPLIAAQSLRAEMISTWVDVGTEEKFLEANQQNLNLNFGKCGEFFYKNGDRVIKFFSDQEIVTKRVARAPLLGDLCPRVERVGTQFFGYQWKQGETFYEVGHPDLFERLLAVLTEKLWRPSAVSPASFRLAMQDFYINKTKNRVLQYLSQGGWNQAFPKEINKKPVSFDQEKLLKITTPLIEHGVAGLIHGDLHFDNIIYNKAERAFSLVDWRQDFGGLLECGDIHYDFAKLLAGILVNFHQLKANDFAVQLYGESAILECKPVPHFEAYQKLLMDTARAFDLNDYKIKILAGFVCINSAPIHHKKVGLFLWLKGLELLDSFDV